MKRNGFTLVELLAVIAILAILVIIALPNVMSMFNDAREKSFTTELKEVYKTAQQAWVSDSLLTTGEKVYSKKKDNSCSNPLDLSGRNNLEYYIRIAKSGAIQEFYATDGTYQYSFEGDGLTITDIKDVVQISKISDSNPKISIECDCVNYDFPNGVVADPSKGPVFIASRNKYYDSLSEAFEHVSSGQTIQLLDYINDRNVITVPAGVTGVKLDLNGQSAYFGRDGYSFVVNGGLEIINTSSQEPYIDFFYGFQNNGTLTFNANGRIESENDFVENNGTLNIYNGNLGARESSSIHNNGTINMSGGEVGGYGEGIDNHGTFNMTGGTVNAYRGVLNESGAAMSISNGATLIGDQVALTNEAGNTLNISNATIKCIYYSDTYGIKNYGTLNLTNVSINTASYETSKRSYGVYNYEGGVMTLNNVTITPATSYSNEYGSWSGGTLATGIYNKGTMTLNTINISSISQSSVGITNSGTLAFKSGTINQVQTGIEQTGGSLTMGTNDSTVSTTAPLLFASYNNGYGVKITGGTFNFYDGLIKCSRGTGFAINGGNPVVPSGYTVNKTTTSGVESAILVHE